MVAAWLSHLVDWVWQVTSSLVSSYGLLGLFVASVLANATLFLPLPITVVVFGLGALAAQNGWGIGYAILVGIVAGVGAAIGELTGYYAGLLGGRALHTFSRGIPQKKTEKLKFQIHKYGAGIIFVAAFLPFPFDVVGIAAGLARFDAKRFLFATALGRVLRDMLLAVAGYYGLELAKTIFA